MRHNLTVTKVQGPKFVANLKFDTKFFTGISDIFRKKIFHKYINKL